MKTESLDWYERRTTGIGGSDASALFGMNPYKTNVELYNEKAFGVKQEIKNPEILKRGHIVEPLLIELFKVDFPQYQVFHTDDDYYICQEYSYMRGEIDAGLIDLKGRKGLLEIKHVEIMNGAQRIKWIGRIPDNCYIQGLHYLLITGFEFIVLKARLKSVFNDEISIQIKHYFIERSDVLVDIEYLKQKEIDFWNNHVLAKKEPGLILPPI